MYQFLLNMWIRGKVTESQINNYTDKEFITKEDAQFILATPQI